LEPADDFDRRQEPSFEHKGEKETREEPSDTEDNRVKIHTATRKVFITERSEKETRAEPEDTEDTEDKRVKIETGAKNVL
jgi:hypothetical protein